MRSPAVARRLPFPALMLAGLFLGWGAPRPSAANDCLPPEIALSDWSIQLARLDSDGWPDILMIHRPTAVSLRLRGTSTGAFSTLDVQQLEGVEPVAARTFVLTRDGRDDVVLLAHGISALETRLTETSGRLRPPVRMGSGFHPVNLDVGDVTLDGFEDVVVTWLLRPQVSLYRSFNGTLQSQAVAYYYPSPRDGVRLVSLDAAIVHWVDSDPRPEVAALALAEDGRSHWILLQVRDRGAASPPLGLVEIEAVELDRPLRQMDRFHASPLAGTGLVLWDSAHNDIVTLVPGAPSEVSEFSLATQPAGVAVADLSEDTLDDLIVLDASRTAVQLYVTISGVPILVLQQPLPRIAEAMALLPTGASLRPEMWIISAPAADGARELLRFAISIAGASLVQTYALPALQSPWGGIPNVVVETRDLPPNPEASPAQKWTAGMGHWTVAAAFPDSAHLQADVRLWAGPHVLTEPEPFVAALPTTITLGQNDRIEVNGSDPAQSQVFLGATHALYDTPMIVSPPAGYYPAPLDLRVHFPYDTFPLHFLMSQGPPPELNWSDEGTIPVQDTDLLCVVGNRGLQIGSVLPYHYALGPRPGPDRDSDQDGLSDAWEFFFFGSLAATPDEDSDGDLFPNGVEYLAIKHPLNAASNPDESIDPADPPELTLASQGGELVLSWLNDPGVSYTVQAASKPAGPWVDRALLTADPTPAIVRQWRQPTAGLPTAEIYRVLAVR